MTVGARRRWRAPTRVAPGERIVIAGNGPLNLQTAAELLDGGADVVAVLEAARARLGAMASAGKRRHGRSLPDDRRPALAARLGGKLHWSRRATRPIGDDRVRGIEAGDLRFEADIVALNYGFASNGAGARWAAAHRFDAARPWLDGDADRRQRPHQPRRGLRHRRWRALRRRARRDGARR